MRVGFHHIGIVFWTVMLFSLTFLCYFPKLSRCIIPCLLIFLVTEYRNIFIYKIDGWKEIYAIYICFLIASLVIAFFSGHQIDDVIRFFLILLLIPIASTIVDKRFEDNWKIFKILIFIKALSIIVIWIAVFIKQEYHGFREWAYNLQVGDIYIFDWVNIGNLYFGIPRVQLRGNTLFVMAFIIEFMRERKLTCFGIVSVLAGLAAGNQAFILGYALFFLYLFFVKVKHFIKKRNGLMLIVLFIVVVYILVYFMQYVAYTLDVKSGNSNLIRVTQARVLLEANPIFGEGLGNIVHIGGREANRYFELQTLYIYNQIGLIGLLLFYLLTFAPYITQKNLQKTVAYFIYLAYTFWNPYCFDSTHIVAILIIGNVLDKQFKYYDSKSVLKRIRIKAKKNIEIKYIEGLRNGL